MRTKLQRAGSLLIAAGAIFLAHTTQANIVYENATGDLNTTYNPGTFEIGDEITLAPGGGALTNFTFQYSAFSIGGNGQAQLRFYENDGPLSTGFSSPGTMFFNSGVFPIGDGNGVTLTFDNDSDFGPAGLIAASHFTWSVQFFGFTGGDAVGVDLFDPVTVGSNTPDYWEYDGSTWTRRVSPDGPINFAARVEAVPEPSIIALGALGCVLGWGWFRRKRN